MSKLSLSALNTSSAKSGGKWNVGVYHPYVDTYEYTWGSQQREGKNFVCLLVSLDNPEECWTATLKKTNAVGLLQGCMGIQSAAALAVGVLLA